MKKISFVFLLLVSFHLQAQVLKEKVLRPAGENLNYMNSYGVKSVYASSGNTMRSLLSIFEFADLGDNGFMYRDKFHFIKYNDNLEVEWESDIEKEYSLQSLPKGGVVGDSRGVYFYLISDNPASFNQAIITKFDKTGKTTQTKFLNKKRFKTLAATFVNSKGFNFLVYNVNHKEKTVDYFLVTYSHADLSESVTPIDLATEPYEFDDFAIVNGNHHIWYPEIKKGDRIVFIKKHFKKIADSKEKELVVKTADYTLGGKPVVKNYTFTNNKYTEGKFMLPECRIDIENNWLYLNGMLTTGGSEKAMDAMYIYKYELNASQPVFAKQIPLSELASKMKWAEHFDEKKTGFSFVTYAQSLAFIGYVDPVNKGIRLVMQGKGSGLAHGKMYLHAIRFDQNGEVIMIEELYQVVNPILFIDYEMVPDGYTVLYRDKAAVIKNSGLDYIFNQSGKMKTENVLWSAYDRKDYSILTYIKEENSEIKAFKIAR